MANTSASAFSAAIQASVQSKVLRNLRAALLWANDAWTEQGTFDKATDQLLFGTYPDLSITTPLTPLTEGTAPTARVITFSAVTVGTSQYGDLVGLTDLAKIKAPHDVAQIAAERVGRAAQEVIDRVTRDAIFAGGTAFYMSGDHSTRATLDSSDTSTGALLIKLRSTMNKAKVPVFPDGKYLLLLGPNMAYDLQVDSGTSTGWLDINKYSRPEQIISGEIGTLHGFRIVIVNNAPTFSSSTTVYAGLAIGAIKGWGAGDLQTLQAYHVAPGGDHTDPIAQVELVGWKMDFGVAPLNNSYYYRVEADATTL